MIPCLGLRCEGKCLIAVVGNGDVVTCYVNAVRSGAFDGLGSDVPYRSTDNLTLKVHACGLAVPVADDEHVAHVALILCGQRYGDVLALTCGNIKS